MRRPLNASLYVYNLISSSRALIFVHHIERNTYEWLKMITNEKSKRRRQKERKTTCLPVSVCVVVCAHACMCVSVYVFLFACVHKYACVYELNLKLGFAFDFFFAQFFFLAKPAAFLASDKHLYLNNATQFVNNTRTLTWLRLSLVLWLLIDDYAAAAHLTGRVSLCVCVKL